MEHDDQPIEDEEAQAAAIPLHELQQDTPRSLLDSLKQRKQELDEKKEVILPIPGYDTGEIVLAAGYRLLDGKEIDAIGARVTKQTKDRWQRNVYAAVDLFITACTGIFYQESGDASWKPLTVDGVPVSGYTTELARGLGFEAETARKVVFGVFASNDVAIMQHNVRLNLWMGNTSRDVDEDFLGEA